MLADALALADEEKPDLMISMATLTGAARVAVGPDLAPFYTDAMPTLPRARGRRRAQCADPVWRMPFHAPYEAMIEPGHRRSRQCAVGRVCGVDHRRAVPAPLRDRHAALRAFRHLRLAARRRARPAQGRRAAWARARILGALPAALKL